MTLRPPALHIPAARRLEVVDSHTCGQPTRVVIAGAGLTPGMDPCAARDALRDNADWVRRTAVMEPRAHRSMFGVAMIPPAHAGDLFGAVYMDAHGYPDMCGHATIGFATTLFAAGWLTAADGRHDFAIRTPMGLVDLTARLEQGVCRAVAFRAPLAYYLGAVDLVLGDGRTCRVEIGHGGQWYAFVPVALTGLSVAPAHIDGLVAAAAPVRAALAAQLALVDPLSGRVPAVGNIVWVDDELPAGADGRNVPVAASGAFDRSPCGTATCARMAVLAATGRLAVGQPFVNVGLMGTRYDGQLVAARTVDGVAGFVPQVEGSAWMTGQGMLVVDPADPLGDSFLCPP